MIDLGISKLALIGAVALVVIGPERLPRVARTVGALLGKAQRYVSKIVFFRGSPKFNCFELSSIFLNSLFLCFPKVSRLRF